MTKSERYHRVALELLRAPEDRHWSNDLRGTVGLRSGALYPILWDMLADELVEDGWETAAPMSPRGKPRRYYRLTEKGKTELGSAAPAARQPRARFRPRPVIA